MIVNYYPKPLIVEATGLPKIVKSPRNLDIGSFVHTQYFKSYLSIFILKRGWKMKKLYKTLARHLAIILKVGQL
jgi:hypothetical protein